MRTKHNSTKAELAQAIARHFASQPAMEMDSIAFFIYAVKNQGEEEGCDSSGLGACGTCIRLKAGRVRTCIGPRAGCVLGACRTCIGHRAGCVLGACRTLP